MTKSNNEWGPENMEVVGWQFYQDGAWHNGYENIKDHRKNTESAGFPVRDVFAPIVEIKTEAEKRRDEAIQEMANHVTGCVFSAKDPVNKAAETILGEVVDAGYINPKRLTTEVISLIIRGHYEPSEKGLLSFAKAIEAYIRGELDL